MTFSAAASFAWSRSAAEIVGALVADTGKHADEAFEGDVVDAGCRRSLMKAARSLMWACSKNFTPLVMV